MSFFMRTVVGLAIVAGVVRIFRKDISRIVETLRGPTTNFIKEVRQELDVSSVKKAGTTAVGSDSASVISDTGLAAAAAEAAKEKEKVQAPSELK